MLKRRLAKKYQVVASYRPLVKGEGRVVYVPLASDATSSDITHRIMEEINDADSSRRFYGKDGSGFETSCHGNWADVSPRVKITDLVFDSEKKARDYLDTKTMEKWNEAIAVRYKKSYFPSREHDIKAKEETKAKIAANSDIKKLTAQFEKAEVVYQKAISDLAHHKYNMTSEMLDPGTSHLSCRNCKSKVAKKYVKQSDTHYAEHNVPKYIPQHSLDSGRGRGTHGNLYSWYSERRDSNDKNLHESNLPICPVCNDSLITPVQKKSMEKIISDLEKKRDACATTRQKLEDMEKEISEQIAKKFLSEDNPWLIAARIYSRDD